MGLWMSDRVQRAPNPPEFAQPRLSRGSKGGRPQRGVNIWVCLFLYGRSLPRHLHDRPYRRKHTQICTPSLGTTAPWPPAQTGPLTTLTSLNKEVRPFFLGDNSIWSCPSVSSVSDYSIWRSWRLFQPCDHNIWSISVHCLRILLSLRKNEQEKSRPLNWRRLRSSRAVQIRLWVWSSLSGSTTISPDACPTSLRIWDFGRPIVFNTPPLSMRTWGAIPQGPLNGGGFP